MKPEEYLQRMRELGVSRGMFEKDNAFPPDFGSAMSQHLQSPYINRKASGKIHAPATDGDLSEAFPPVRCGTNKVSAYLSARSRVVNRTESREAVIAEARRRAKTPVERFYCLLFERDSSSEAVATLAGFSAEYTRRVVRTGLPWTAWVQVRAHLTAEERAVLGWDERGEPLATDGTRMNTDSHK